MEKIKTQLQKQDLPNLVQIQDYLKTLILEKAHGKPEAPGLHQFISKYEKHAGEDAPAFNQKFLKSYQNPNGGYGGKYSDPSSGIEICIRSLITQTDDCNRFCVWGCINGEGFMEYDQ